MINLTFYNRTAHRQFSHRWFEKILRTAARDLDLNPALIWGVSVLMVSPKEMASLNWRWRKQKKTADVLSFPLRKAEEVKDLFHFSSAGAIIELGDIFLCPREAAQEARRQKQNFKFWMSLLAIHGFLHLFGFDHQNQKQWQVMQFWEKKILSSLR